MGANIGQMVFPYSCLQSLKMFHILLVTFFIITTIYDCYIMIKTGRRGRFWRKKDIWMLFCCVPFSYLCAE